MSRPAARTRFLTTRALVAALVVVGALSASVLTGSSQALAATPTPTTAPSSTTPSTKTEPPVIPAPLVTVKTMAHVGSEQGVLLTSYAQSPVPCSGREIPIQFGQGCFYADPGHAKDYVQLLVLNRKTLQLVSNAPFNCQYQPVKGELSPYDLPLACMNQLGTLIKGLTEADLVIAANQPGDSADSRVQPPVGLGLVLSGMPGLIPGFQNGFPDFSIGINAMKWYEAAKTHTWRPYAVRGTFSAVGIPHWTSHGVWSMASKPDQWEPNGTSSLVADLAVDNTGSYSPVTPFSLGQGELRSPGEDVAPPPITKVLLQAHTPWPLASNGKNTAATSAIGKEVGLGPDPRAQYYSNTYDRTEWLRTQLAIDKLKYHSTEAFSASDFRRAQQELSREIGYVMDVERYTEQIAEPFQKASTTLWADFNNVVQHVTAATGNTDNTAQVVVGILVTLLVTILTVVGAVAAPVTGGASLPAMMTIAAAVIAGAYSVAAHWASIDLGDAAASFDTTASQYGQQLANRLDATEQEILVRWRNVIVADYGKLKTVADCATGKSDCHLEPTKWMWTSSSDEQRHMKTVLRLALERDLYTTLVPAKYHLRLALHGLQGFDAEFPKNRAMANDLTNFCAISPPFKNDTGKYVYESDGHLNVDVLTNLPSGVLDAWHAASKHVFDRMFGKLDPTSDFTKGGLGIDEAAFMNDNWPKPDPPGQLYKPGNKYAWSIRVTEFPITHCSWRREGY